MRAGLRIVLAAATIGLAAPWAIAQQPPPPADAKVEAKEPSGAAPQPAPPQGAEPAKAEQAGVELPRGEPPKVDAPPVEPPRAAVPPPPPARPGEIVVASWSGAYGRAQDVAIFGPFTSKTGVRIKLEAHDSSGRELERLKAGGLKADVIDMGTGSLDAACEAGLLERLDQRAIAGADDFLTGGLRPCGIASLAWSSILVVNKDRFKGPPPVTLAEAFDARRFPGPRALPRSPRYLLEVALMADGVPPGEVYGRLSEEEGIARALTRLRTVAPGAVWWSTASEAVQILRDRKAAIGLAFNGRAFQEFAFNPSFAMIWDHQIYDFNYWAVPKGTVHAAIAREFISFATEPERLATSARHFPYGPARKSAVPLVGRHAALGIDLQPHLPTTPANLATALRFDQGWWARHEPRVRKAFDSWYAEVTAPPPAPPPAAPPKRPSR